MEFYRLPIAHVRKDTRDAVVVELGVPESLREAFAFTQGQYLTVRAAIDGAEERRSYSICTSPFSGKLRVAIKRVDDGVFSSWRMARCARAMNLKLPYRRGASSCRSNRKAGAIILRSLRAAGSPRCSR